MKTVLITGASAGIGRGLAHEFARRGYHLTLTARRMAALEEISAEIKSVSPQTRIELRQLDVMNIGSVRSTMLELDSICGGLDMVIANAGIGGGGEIGSGHFAQDLAVIQTNVLGAMVTVDTAIEMFKKRNRGHVVAISSVAAFRGFPGNASYCASKAALTSYMDTLRSELHHSPIYVTTLFPGFIDTDINKALKVRPFVINVQRGAKIMVDLIERRKKVSTVPVYPWNIIGMAVRLAPNFMLARWRAR